MKQFRRISAVLLAVLVLFAMMTALFTVVHNAGHVCAGDHCPVCEITEVCLHTLKVLRDALLVLCVAFCLICYAATLAARPVFRARMGTPVSLKVKLLN